MPGAAAIRARPTPGRRAPARPTASSIFCWSARERRTAPAPAATRARSPAGRRRAGRGRVSLARNVGGGWILAIAEAGIVGGFGGWFAGPAVLRPPPRPPDPHPGAHAPHL